MTPRQMRREELDLVLDWAAAEGWNPGLDDADAFWAADPDGFFVAEIANRPVAAISVVNHTSEFAFLGLYICLPEFRGQGIGLALWQHAIEHAGTRTIGLDGVPDRQDNYRKSDFVWAGETRRFEGKIPGAGSASVRLASEKDVQILSEAEAQRTGVEKRAFNAVWLRQAETRRTYLIEGSSSFATVRSCREGHKIGPLVARSVEEAVLLVRHIAQEVSAPIVIDVPDNEAELADWCAAQGMTVSFGTARMYRGAPPVQGDGVLAVSTLELG